MANLIAVNGGWMVEGDDNIYPNQYEAIAAQYLLDGMAKMSQKLKNTLAGVSGPQFAAYPLAGEATPRA